MAAKLAVQNLPDAYFELVKRSPLMHIRDANHRREAQAVIDRLLRDDLDEGGAAYLDALTDLVETYETEHAPIPDASEADVLRELMSSHGLSQLGLAKAVGMSQSTISAVLNGKRSLTKGQVVALARHFNIPPAVFLPA